MRSPDNVGAAAPPPIRCRRSGAALAADAAQPGGPGAPTGVVPGRSADLARIQADVDFWAARVARDPDDFVAANRWGLSEIDLGRATGDLAAYEQAAAAFDATLRRDPSNAAALALKGGVLVSLHRFGEAAALASDVLARQAQDPSALGTLGDASLELGDLATARDAYSRANALAPSAATLVRLGHLAFIEGDVAAARRAARSAVAAAAEEGAQGERAAFYRYQLGDVLVSTGDRAGAARAYRAAATADPSSFLAHWGLARIAAAQGDLDGAIRELTTAIAIVPRPDFLARRADLYTLRAASGDARRAAADAATVEAIARLAGKAAGVYDRTLATYLADHGLDPDRAVGLARNELAVRKDVYGYDSMAWTLFAAGRPVEAEAAMTRALAVGTRDAKLLYHAGMIAAALDRTDAARSLLDEALALDPSFDPLQAARARRTLDGLR